MDNPFLDTLEGKTAFVTGAASGIGLGIATALTRAGAKVMLCDIDEQALAKAVDGLRTAGADVDGVRADVSLKSAIQSAADRTIERFGKVHVVVNNAGVVGNAEYGSWTDASWDWILGVNLRSVIWGFEIFGPIIEAQGEGGHFIATSSMSGLSAVGTPVYGVSKYGVVALTEGLREPLARRGIGVSTFCPGPTNTQIMFAPRNMPERFVESVEDWPEEGPIADAYRQSVDYLAKGLDPYFVGELVREGIEGDWPYIFTDTRFESSVNRRFDAITRGFDLIRGRRPEAEERPVEHR